MNSYLNYINLNVLEWIMFRESRAFSSFSVDSIDNVKDFYENVLGLEVKSDEYGLHIVTNGNNPIMVYSKGSDHVAATHTVLNFPVSDIEKAVDELISKGVEFEQYDGEMKTNEKGISEMESMKMAWFKDPAGNFISLIQEK
jgi:catechol-2,3-dioxygenase